MQNSLDPQTEEKYAKLLQDLCVQMYSQCRKSLYTMEMLYPGSEITGAITLYIMLEESVNKYCKDNPKMRKVVDEQIPKIREGVLEYLYPKDPKRN